MTDVSDMRALIAAELADVNTCLPGKIIEYDGQFATVQPTLSKQLANGESLAAPKIVRVPVCWPVGDINGARALFTVPLKAGDAVLLNFSQRGLDDWLGGVDGAPGDPRQFDLSDCFASPMLRPGGLVADTERVSLQYGPMTLKITAEGQIDINTPAPINVTTEATATIKALAVLIDAPQTTTTGNLLVGGFLSMGTGGSGPGARAIIRGPVEVIDGSVTVPGHDVIASGKSLATHVHGGVTTGGGNTGGPV